LPPFPTAQIKVELDRGYENLLQNRRRIFDVAVELQIAKPMRTLISRERVVSVIVALILGSVAFVFGLRWLEAAMTFHPVRISEDGAVLPVGAEDVWLTSDDGVRLHGWFYQSRRGPASATILHFHGNGGNITNVAWVAERLAIRGFDTLLIDYRGYGRSLGQASDEAGLYADGDAALSYLLNTRRVPAERIVLYGQSLGTTVATDVASRNKCGALILESGFSSSSSVAAKALPWLPRSLHFLAKNRFESARKLKNITIPVLITHGDPDPVIAVEEAHALFAAANEPRKLHIFPGVGHNVFGSLGDTYLDLIEEFIRESQAKKK
jgi:uncharacterized protein